MSKCQLNYTQQTRNWEHVKLNVGNLCTFYLILLLKKKKRQKDKTKYKEKIFKTSVEKGHIIIGKNYLNDTGPLLRNYGGQKELTTFFKC